MAQITTTNDILPAMKPGLDSITIIYESIEKNFLKTFGRKKTERNYIVTTQFRNMQVAQQTEEGSAAAFSGIKALGEKTIRIKNYTMGTAISFQALQDNLYKESAPRFAANLLKSQLERMNLESAKVFINGTNPAYPGWDGRPFFGTHSVLGFEVTNKLRIDAPMHEGTLFKLFQMNWNFRDPGGIRMASENKLLQVGIPGIRPATVLLQSDFRTGMASFETNPLKGRIADGTLLNRYILPNTYQIITNQEGLWFVERDTFRTASQGNVSVFALWLVSIVRYAFDFDSFYAALQGASAVVDDSL
jgi:hypothetical protein